VKRTRGRVVHVESEAELDRRLDAGARSLRGWRVRGLDLAGYVDRLLAGRVSGAMFLGCTFAPGDADRLTAAGALVLPVVGDSPLDAHRSSLYTAAELYDAKRYADTLDARAYAWTQRPAGPDDTLVAALHDHAIDEALDAWRRERHLVGVMGGHALRRGDADYADAARLGRALGGHAVVATGGGPGAMEAANLGGRLAHADPGALDDTLARLATAPSFRPSVDDWLVPALAVAAGIEPAESLGIPTWHYGHEPANVFATAIAKYVGNPTREAVLLEICEAGIVFLPGAAGTVQEVFQDACENYYADATAVAPMVLVGRRHWTETVPAWPLLKNLAAGRPMEPHVHLVDDVDEAVALVQSDGGG
jgi:predicted Rossmann-fold nucleotide-binding protein